MRYAGGLWAGALWAGRVTLLAISFGIGTWILGWWAVPLFAAAAGVMARHVPRQAGAAALGATLAWAVLLAWNATHGSVWSFARIAGGAMGISGWLLVLMTFVFPAALAWSAASVAQRLARGKTVTPHRGSALNAPSNATSTQASPRKDGSMRKALGVLASLLLVGVLAGCADNGTAPEEAAEVDATADALSFAEALGLPGTNTDQETGSAPIGTSRNPCRYDAGNGRWVCAPVTREGITFQRSFAYLDADGDPMRRFDPLLTAAVQTRNAVFGTAQRDNATVRIRSAGELTVSGLLGDETTRILDGREIGRREMDLVSDQGTASSLLEFANQTVAVVVPVVRPTPSAAPTRVWPLSGQTIRGHALTVTRNGETHTERWRETTTFNGTAIVRVEIVSPRGTRSCLRNLETGALRCE